MAYNVIWVGPADGPNHKPLTVEGKATEAVLPGKLVAQGAGGDISLSANDGTTASRLLIAREIGEQFGKTITDSWATDDHLIAVSPRSGEFFNVAVAAAQTIIVGTPLTSNGDGTFKVAGDGDVVYCYAQRVSTGAAANTLVLATV